MKRRRRAGDGEGGVPHVRLADFQRHQSSHLVTVFKAVLSVKLRVQANGVHKGVTVFVTEGDGAVGFDLLQGDDLTCVTLAFCTLRNHAICFHTHTHALRLVLIHYAHHACIKSSTYALRSLRIHYAYYSCITSNPYALRSLRMHYVKLYWCLLALSLVDS